MYNQVVVRVTDYLVVQGIVKEQDIDIIKYGITTGIELLLNIATTIVIGFLLNMVIESIIFLFAFCAIRVYSGGFHLNKAHSCYIFSNAIVLSVLLIVKFLPQSLVVSTSMVCLIISLPILLLFSPRGSKNKPLTEKEKNIYKRRVLLHLIIELLVITLFFLKNHYSYGLIISLGIFACTCLIILSVVTKEFSKRYELK